MSEFTSYRTAEIHQDFATPDGSIFYVKNSFYQLKPAKTCSN